MDSRAREALAEHVLSFSNATQTEVVVMSSNTELTRFTHNAVHQSVAESDITVKVRVIAGQQTGVAASNLLDDAALRDLVARATAMAQLAPADRGQPLLPGGGTILPPEGAYVAQTAYTPPEQRARMCDAIFETAESHDYWCAGFVSTGTEGISIANSSGARASFDSTDAGVNVKMNAADSSGFGEGYSTDVLRLDAASIARTSAQKAKRSAQPREAEPGLWTVILEPAAFAELLTYAAGHFSAQSFDDGSSFLSGGLGMKYFGDNVTITDDYAHPLKPGMPFDYEGQPRKRVVLVQNGVARDIVTDSYYARKLQRENTGHALPAPNSYGPQAQNLVISPGSKPLTELIAQTKRGLLVTRFWYIRTVDQKKAIVTGMTRDGTFLIENGAVGCGVRNLRFNQSILDALRHCELGDTLHRTGSYSYSLVCPAVKIEGFSFSSGTAF